MRNHRRHEEDDRGVDVAVREHQRQDGLVVGGGGRAEQVDGVAETRLGRQPRGQRLTRVVAQRRQLEPCRLARVGAQDAEPAGVGDDGHRSAGRQRLGGEHRRDVEQLAERVGADDARLVEQRVDRLLGAGQRRGVRARGADPRAAAAALHGQDRLAARHPPRDPAEAPRVAERLEVDQHELGRGVVLEVLEQVVGGHVGLVADRHEGRQAEPARGRLAQEGEAERSALRREADVAGGDVRSARTWR